MKKLLFVYNPCSGAGLIEKKVPKIIKVFESAGYETELYPTKARCDGRDKIAKDGLSYDRVVVAGGDGMLNELVNAVMTLERPIEVGYLPAGTVNDFAHTHRISKKPVKAAKIAVSDNVRAVDVGRFNDVYFSYVAATGFGTKASYATDQKAKKRWKILAYAFNALKDLNKNALKAMCRKMTVIADGKETQGEFVFAAVSNSFSIAGLKNLTDKHCILDDGMLEGLFIPLPKGIKEWDMILNSFLSRNYEKSSLMTFIKAKRFEIITEKAAWTLDGELGGEFENISICACNKSLHIALPKRKIKKAKSGKANDQDGGSDGEA